jgi:3-dehydroquinate synthase
MKPLQQNFQINYSYSVSFTENLFDTSNLVLADFLNNFGLQESKKKALFVIDSGVIAHHPHLVKQIKTYFTAERTPVSLVENIIVVTGGEDVKNDTEQLHKVVEAVDVYGIDRHSFLIAIGGGGVLDMAGYAAAISHRGVKHVRIPTTVLSQNDSGVGVKNGVNFQGKKNFLGTFVPPIAVFNDSEFLKTLDDRDWRSGISEAIKVALIKDASFFEWIEENVEKLAARDLATMNQLIYRCAEMHLEHIRSGDPFESGSSRPLDFGHWAAHKLEYLTNFEVRHGEAVAIGIALDCAYAYLIGKLSQEALDRIVKVIVGLGFDLYHPKLEENNKENLIIGLNEFREHLGGRLTIMLLDTIGKGVEVHEMNAQLIRDAVDYLADYSISTPQSI